ncbi:MAG: DUF364 domain-containing protein [Arenicellales bacterium]|nr:DUF364 domain-containing protein [Arenicellales bacterium]
MTITTDFLDMVERIRSKVTLPPIREIHVAISDCGSQPSSKFGAIVLADDTVGLTYMALDDALRDIQPSIKSGEFIGSSPAQVALLYDQGVGWKSALGMAAINAISQYVLRRSGIRLAEMGETLDLLDLTEDDRVGLVGYFPPLVDQIRPLHIPLTVLELDEKWLQHEGEFEVTLDPTQLARSNKVLCTATTLINHTLDSVLPHCAEAEQVVLIGPTAGCLPDPLFARGVSGIGGCQVLDSARFVKLWSTHQRWRQTTRRYVINKKEYPGFESLLGRMEEGEVL